MVTVFLRGGLGNQMFQYAAGLRIAKKNNTGLLLDTTYLRDRTPRPNFTYRNFDLDIFTLEPRFTAFSKVANAVPISGFWLGLDIVTIKAMNALGIRRVFSEKKNYIFEQEVFDARGNIFLLGRWQTEKYFEDISDEVRKAFAFRMPLMGEAAEVAQAMAASNSVALHVRRGDYVAFKNVEAIMGKTNTDYYSQAIAEMAKRTGGEPHFFVFSDDIAWCKENIKPSFPTRYLDDASAGPKAAFHLELMSRAKHNIIANSTFSWWGAWLNPNPNKIVIAPKQWEKDVTAENSDIIPKRWITL